MSYCQRELQTTHIPNSSPKTPMQHIRSKARNKKIKNKITHAHSKSICNHPIKHLQISNQSKKTQEESPKREPLQTHKSIDNKNQEKGKKPH